MAPFRMQAGWDRGGRGERKAARMQAPVRIVYHALARFLATETPVPLLLQLRGVCVPALLSRDEQRQASFVRVRRPRAVLIAARVLPNVRATSTWSTCFETCVAETQTCKAFPPRHVDAPATTRAAAAA